MFFFILEYYKFIILFTLYIFRFYKELLIAALSLSISIIYQSKVCQGINDV